MHPSGQQAYVTISIDVRTGLLLDSRNTRAHACPCDEEPELWVKPAVTSLTRPHRRVPENKQAEATGGYALRSLFKTQKPQPVFRLRRGRISPAFAEKLKLLQLEPY